MEGKREIDEREIGREGGENESDITREGGEE